MRPEGKQRKRRPLAQRIAAVLWPSFLAACVSTMVMFAFVDPVELHAITFPEWNVSRMAGYSIGFFMFWGVTVVSSFGTWVLLRSAARINIKQPDNPQ